MFQQYTDSQSTWWYTEKIMATMYKRICRITSRLKGDHVYQSNSKNCEVEPENLYSEHAIVVSKKINKEMVIVGHVPDALAVELFQMIQDGTLVMKCKVTGDSRPAIEGIWNQGGGIKIPCQYELSMLASKKDEKKHLRKRLNKLLL